MANLTNYIKAILCSCSLRVTNHLTVKAMDATKFSGNEISEHWDPAGPAD